MSQLLEDNYPPIQSAGFNTNKAATFGGSVTITGALTVSGATIFTGAQVQRRNVLASSGNTALATTQSGALVLMDSATVDFTLPVVAAADVGVFFDFKVTVTSTNQSITCQSGDLYIGTMPCLDVATPLIDGFAADVSDDVIFSTNGTTTGGLINSWYRFTCISNTRWWVEGMNLGSGTLATPFS